MHSYRRLSVWRKAHELTLRVYRVADAIHRVYPALADEFKRAALSIPSNIVEGSTCAVRKQFAQCLGFAVAAAREVDCYLQLAVDLGAITSKDHAMLEARTDEVTRMLIGLRKTVLRQAKRQ